MKSVNILLQIGYCVINAMNVLTDASLLKIYPLQGTSTLQQKNIPSHQQIGLQSEESSFCVSTFDRSNRTQDESSQSLTSSSSSTYQSDDSFTFESITDSHSHRSYPVVKYTRNAKSPRKVAKWQTRYQWKQQTTTFLSLYQCFYATINEACLIPSCKKMNDGLCHKIHFAIDQPALFAKTVTQKL